MNIFSAKELEGKADMVPALQELSVEYDFPIWLPFFPARPEGMESKVWSPNPRLAGRSSDTPSSGQLPHSSEQKTDPIPQSLTQNALTLRIFKPTTILLKVIILELYPFIN